MNKDIITLVGGFLSALLFFMTTIGISFDWFNEDSINAFLMLLGAAVTLGVNLYAVRKNTYIGKKAKEQKQVLKDNNLLK